jgi:hypothetical protein
MEVSMKLRGGRDQIGWIITLVVLALVGGRYLWVWADRPDHHQEEIAAAFGSVALYYGSPQPDHAGNQVTYVRTADQGFGVFLANVSSGRKTLVRAEVGSGSLGDDCQLKVWPWSPDDSCFVYSEPLQLGVANPTIGKTVTELDLPAKVAAITWLTPTAFVCLDVSNHLCQFEQQADGAWGRTELTIHLKNLPSQKAASTPAGGNAMAGLPMDRFLLPFNPLAKAFKLVTLNDHTIAWGQRTRLWSMDLNSNDPVLLLDLEKTAPANTTLRDVSYSAGTGHFLLSCVQDGQNSLCSFIPDESSFGLQPILTAASVRDAFWLPGANSDGWIGLQANFLLAKREGDAEPARGAPFATIDALTATLDGQRLLMFGTAGDEPSAGLWQYDLSSAKLQVVASYADHPSPDAENMEHGLGSLLLPSGERVQYEIFEPSGIVSPPRRKSPLVIGNTDFGVAMRGAHGRLWIPALAAAGAYVIIVNRADWWRGIEQWGDNVTAVYDQIKNTLPIDKNRVFLFGASAETRYMSEFMTNSPGLWQGAILVNPTGLPDFSNAPAGQRRPRILISAGGEEHEDSRFKEYQVKALNDGVMADVVISPGEGHHFVGNAAQLERAEAMMRFIFKE